MPIKFKTRKFINEPGDSHFLTFSTFDRIPYLANDHICHHLAESLQSAKEKHDFSALAYVFMPDHAHLVIHPKREKYDIAEITKSFKTSSSKKARNQFKIATRLWEPGGGHDKNITSEAARMEIIKYVHLNPIRKGLVEDLYEYRWSSARWYHLGEPTDIQCEYIGMAE